ncbi:MAG: TonB family protein [Candidatus Methylacidiphilales bacterium]
MASATRHSSSPTRPDHKNRHSGSRAVSSTGLDGAASLVELETKAAMPRSIEVSAPVETRTPGTEKKSDSRIGSESKRDEAKNDVPKNGVKSGLAGADKNGAERNGTLNSGSTPSGGMPSNDGDNKPESQKEEEPVSTSLPLSVKLSLLYKNVTVAHRALVLALLIHGVAALAMYDFVLMYVRDGQAIFPTIGEEFAFDSIGESVAAEGVQTDVPPAPGEMATTPDPLPEATLNEQETQPTEMTLDTPPPPTPEVPMTDPPMPDLPTPTPVADELAKEPEPELAMEPLTPPLPMLSVDLPPPPDAVVTTPETPPEPPKDEKPPEKIQIAQVAPKPRPKPKAVAQAPTPAPPAPPRPAPPAPPKPAAPANTGKTATASAPATVGQAGQAGRRGPDSKPGTGAEGEPGGTGKQRQGTGGTARTASYAFNPAPNYPDAARKANQEGVVVLGGTVSESGSVTSVRIVRSSGFPMLDSAAMNAVSRWRLRTPAPSTFVVPVRFRLKG